MGEAEEGTGLDVGDEGLEAGFIGCLAGEGLGEGGISPSCPDRALWVWQFKQTHSFCKTVAENSVSK